MEGVEGRFSRSVIRAARTISETGCFAVLGKTAVAGSNLGRKLLEPADLEPAEGGKESDLVVGGPRVHQ